MNPDSVQKNISQTKDKVLPNTIGMNPDSVRGHHIKNMKIYKLNSLILIDKRQTFTVRVLTLSG